MKMNLKQMVVILVVGVLGLQTQAEVKDFPVTGKDGAAIQAAIDAAAEAGGGRVVVKAGEYPSRPLYLKSHVELHLEKDARVVFTTNSTEFAGIPKSVVKGNGMGAAFIMAWDAEDIALTGEGVFDGQGDLYFAKRPWRGKNPEFYDPIMARSLMVAFARCKNIRMKDVTFWKSANWTMRLRLCENLDLDNIKVINDLKFINADGLDIDGCKHLKLRNSTFLTGDDAVITRAIPEKGSRLKVVTEDILIENCDLTSACQCLRLGCPSDDTVRNVVVRNVRMEGRNGIVMYNPNWYLSTTDEGNINLHDLLFENITGKLTGHAIQFNTHTGIKIRGLRDVVFRNVEVADKNGLQINTNAYSPYERVRFENVVYNGVKLADGEHEARGTDNRNPLARSKPGDYNYKAPKPYLKPVYRFVESGEDEDLERAIAEVKANEKGVVVVEKGEYELDDIELGNDFELRIKKGAKVECDSILAKDKQRVAITGMGEIEVDDEITFSGCTGVRLDGINVNKGEKKPIILEGCKDIEIDALRAGYELKGCEGVRTGPINAGH